MKRILTSVRVVGSGGGRVDGNGRGRMRRREVGGPRWWRGCVRRGDRMGAGRGRKWKDGVLVGLLEQAEPVALG